MSKLSFTSNSFAAHPNTSTIAIKADTGASQHYFKLEDRHLLTNVKPVTQSSNIHLPNNTCIQATEQGHATLHQSLPPQATTVQIVPKLTNSSLISIGQLCDHDCVALFHKNFLKICKNNKVIINGIRNK